MNLAWVPHVLSIELKKAFSYRVVFWVQFLMGSGTEIAVSYFVWKAVFFASGAERLQGFDLHGLVYYSLFASFAAKLTRGTERGYLSMDIYDGSLTRYLLYPLPFFPYKYVTHLTQQLLGVVQFLIAIGILYASIGGSGLSITPFSFCAGVATCLLTGYLHFVMLSCIELIAFWQDVVWNLMVMFRFCLSLLGGALVPLVFFPDWGQRAVSFSPFPLMVSFPARTMLGQVGLQEWLISVVQLAIWGAIFSGLLAWIWGKGTKRYSGVGQ